MIFFFTKEKDTPTQERDARVFGLVARSIDRSPKEILRGCDEQRHSKGSKAPVFIRGVRAGERVRP